MFVVTPVVDFGAARKRHMVIELDEPGAHRGVPHVAFSAMTYSMTGEVSESKVVVMSLPGDVKA